MKSPKSLSIIESIGYWLSIGLGLGLAPLAPGTFGSLLGPPLVWLVQYLARWVPMPVFSFQAIVGIALFFLGVPICSLGSRVLGRKDPGAVVFDEIVAFFVVFAMVPVTWLSAIAGFLLFRLFDISKPYPVKKLEKYPDGWGVMLDDLMAGLYASIALVIFQRWIVPLFYSVRY